MARPRTALGTPDPDVPDWVRECVVEDWLEPRRITERTASDRTLELHAWSLWIRERGRWARDHHVPRDLLPRGSRPVWRRELANDNRTSTPRTTKEGGDTHG